MRTVPPKQNKYLQPLNAPVDNTSGSQKTYVPWQWGINQKIQAKRVIVSQAHVKSFQQQITGPFAYGTVGNGGTVSLLSELSPVSPHVREPMFAVPYAAIFLGTSATANSQIFPVLGTANGTQFPLQGGLDYWQFNGTSPVWTGYVINNSGGLATIGFNVTWQYLWFNQGTSSI